MQNDNNAEHKSGNIAAMFNWIWTFFSSLKLALALILLIGAMSLLGAFYPNVNAFHSWWFIFTGACLMLNILVCSLNRWTSIKSAAGGGPVRQETGYYCEGTCHQDINFAASPADASQTVQNVLRRRGFRVRTDSEESNIYVAADKNRYARLGTFANHLSLVLFVLAYIMGNYLGFRDTDFAVAEGATREIGHNTGLSVRLISFTDEYYPDNTPKDYRSEVVLYEAGREVRQATVRVNQPLEYKGIRIYQSYFGPAVQLRISRSGTILFQGSVPLDRTARMQEVIRPAGTLNLPDAGLSIQVAGPAAGMDDQVVTAGQLAIVTGPGGSATGAGLAKKGVPLDINGTEFVYQTDSRYSGFQVSSDPANAFVWIASSLFILGIVMVFYFPHRRVRILLQSQPPLGSRMIIRMDMPGRHETVSGLESIVTDIRRELSARKQS
jgi:cytochrome c biogenesis protein